MNKRFPLYAALILIASMFTASCLGGNDGEEYAELTSPKLNSIVVDSFKLAKNDSVLVGLSNVFFSIDLDRAVIYNADSLPKGTNVSSLKVEIGVADASKAEITMPNFKEDADTVIDYLENPADHINFNRGYVTLHLESANAEYKRDYTIYLNVHKMYPDSMIWDQISSTQLPSTLSDIEVQRTVEFQGQVLCFTESAGNYCLMTAENPGENWTEQNINLPTEALIESVTAGSTKIFILDTENNLYESTDMGQSWTCVDAKMSHIYGCIGDEVIGVNNSNESYTHVTYPASTESAVAEGCPVKATSQALIYTNEWSTQPFMIIAGGLDANNNPVSGTWGYDGTGWIQSSLPGLPALESPVLIPYYAIKGTDFWATTKSSVLLIIGGFTETIINHTVYISYDYGVHWTIAPEKLQLPETFRPGAYAQALIFNAELTSKASINSIWSDPVSMDLPAWYEIQNFADSRATKPITQWDCPYVYFFGGIDFQNNLNKQLYRGVINKLTFKPLQ